MRVDLFDYELPPERIAQRPLEPRDSSRLLILPRAGGEIEHRVFRDLPRYLRPGDVLVVNDTRVLPARIYGRREKTGGRWEGLFLEETPAGWIMMTKTRGRPAPGEIISVDGADWRLELIERREDGLWRIAPSIQASPVELLASVGHIPLPPYIRGGHDEPIDREQYQTVYADRPGAIAAPTAGLHFTPDLMAKLRGGGIGLEKVTLHVGAGTFQPVSVAETSEHVMHSEWCELDAGTAERLRAARREGGRIIAVGTTVVRTLETAFQEGVFAPFVGSTRIFIVPPYQVRAVDGLITNFHLPRSTLLMLVSAFASRERILDAYKTAVKEKYRFYSYGDAMLIL